MKPETLAITALAALISGSAFCAQYLSVEQARSLMFPEATAFREHNLELSGEQMQQVQKLAGLPARSVNWRVFAALDGETPVGYVFLDEVIGKFELITYAVAINPDMTVRQVEILAYRESHGAEIRSPAWRRQFVGKSVSTGGIAIGEGINNISGATLSCKHVTKGVRRIAAVAQVALQK
jgi:Na+-transporting NADH:ubiquinone oxidoreductase subunit NqrC